MEKEINELKRSDEIKKQIKRDEMNKMKLAYDEQIKHKTINGDHGELNDTEFSLNKVRVVLTNM